MHVVSRSVCLFLVGFSPIWLGFGTALEAGQQETRPEAESNGLSFRPGAETVWEFGLQFEAKGNSSGISAVVPLPVDWPEQSVEIIGTRKSDQVGKISYKKLGADANLMVIKINQLRANERAFALVQVRVDKKLIVAPADTRQFTVPRSVPSKLRKFLKPSPYIDTREKMVIEAAEKIQFDEAAPAWTSVEKIYDWVRENVEYKFDPQIHTCKWALENGIGDCEELSSLFIAICRIKGIPARAVWIPGHTYPEFYLVDREGVGHWFPCQVAGTREFGGMTELKPILQKGDNFRVPGNRSPVRYIQPTLTARDSQGGIAISWVNQQLKPGE